ncbi:MULTISPECIES: AEC family transporter [unclassified Butyrivibrio]|uniref:AEC family transporter n=1 Tax=unclassified Butyrivibrio TaxID=2639466 RepID=UPI0003FC664C|nr:MULTISPECIES: AEC family transporter [unclassified Butyrivibrio]
MALILINQIITMFILSGIGFILFKAGKLTLEGSKNIGNILIFLSLPCVIINGFRVERTPERITGFLLSILAAVVALLIAIAISKLFFKNDEIAAFSASFSNPGFFGVPLIVASMSNGAVFYIASFIACINILQWSYGVSLLTHGKSGFTVKNLLKAPFVYATIIGIVLFLTQLQLPTIIDKCIGFLAGLNTPLAMFTIGIYLAQVDIVDMLKRKSVYVTALVRLVIIPLVTLAALWAIPSSLTEMKIAVLIASACPVGSNVAVYAQLHNSDYGYAVEEVVISTLLSVISIPLIVYLGEMLFAI